MVRRIILTFLARFQNIENPQAPSSRPTPLGFQNKRYAHLPPPPPPPMGLELDKVVSALSTLTSIIQNMNTKVQ